MNEINTLPLNNKFASVLNSVENVEKTPISSTDDWNNKEKAAVLNCPDFSEVMDEIKMEPMDIDG